MSQGRSSYLDGVPFAINPIFLIKKQKDNDNSLDEAQNILYHNVSAASSILNFQYNFTTEKKVLVDKKARKATKMRTSSLLNKNLQNNTKSQIPQDANYLNTNQFVSKSLNSSYENKISHNEENYISMSNLTSASALHNTQRTIKKPPLNQAAVFSNTNLLEPTRQQPQSSTQTFTSKPILQSQDSSHDMFTLASSLDPFNDMELKTINDLEELRSILQNHQIEHTEHPKPKALQKDEGLLDNFGLPKVSFVDLDFNSNKL